MGAHKYTKQHIIDPRALGVNAVLLTASGNSNAIGCEGFNNLTIEWAVTRAAATDLSFFVQSSQNQGTSYGRFRFGDVDPATGIMTLRDLQLVDPNIATRADGSYTMSINHTWIRLLSITGTAATTDTVRMRIILGNV